MATKLNCFDSGKESRCRESVSRKPYEAPREVPPEWKAVQPGLLRLTSSGSPALLVVWAILGAFFVWSLVTIASAAWLPVLYCASVYLFVTRF
jgi:hypothetical protein